MHLNAVYASLFTAECSVVEESNIVVNIDILKQTKMHELVSQLDIENNYQMQNNTLYCCSMEDSGLCGRKKSVHV